MSDEFYFDAGFAVLADDLRRQGFDPGQPLDNEHEVPGLGNVQNTTTGLMIWSGHGPARFLADPRTSR